MSAADWENQRGFDLAQRYDKDGKRTIGRYFFSQFARSQQADLIIIMLGVLTKPDRIGRGDHEYWIRFIRNETKPLENGWFSVKQPDTQDVKDGITWEEARAQEEKFFTTKAPWSSLEPSVSEHLGTANLTVRLSNILSSLIAKRSARPPNSLTHLLIYLPLPAFLNCKMNYRR